MLVDLRKLKDNPTRDFTVDPIDTDAVRELTKSIKQDGFWGGVVGRRSNGDIQIAAGHHRVKAAIAAGITRADLFVSEDLDLAGMVRVYATENATQRGNSGTAQAGSVASAIRFIVKDVLTGGVSGKFSRNGLERIRGNLASEKGVGRDAILQFLDGVPGINEGTVKQALENLKASGDYARIVAEVQTEIEEENKEALKRLAAAEKAKAEAEESERKAEIARKAAAAKAKAAREEADKKRAELDSQRAQAEAALAEKRRKEADEAMEEFESLKQTRDDAEKAKDASAKKEKTFDFEGVAKYLKTPSHVAEFRRIVTGDGIKDYLPVSKQSALARHLVELAASQGAELSSAFIRPNISNLVLNAKTTERRLTKEEQEKLRRNDLEERFKLYQREFSRNCRGMVAAAMKLSHLAKTWPKGFAYPVTREFTQALDSAKKAVAILSKGI